MTKRQKVPMRRDVVTGEMLPKPHLVRIVKNKANQVWIDPTGKAPGRGAYVAISVRLAEQAKQKRVLDRSLGIRLADNLYDELIQYVNRQQDQQTHRELNNHE